MTERIRFEVRTSELARATGSAGVRDQQARLRVAAESVEVDPRTSVAVFAFRSRTSTEDVAVFEGERNPCFDLSDMD